MVKIPCIKLYCILTSKTNLLSAVLHMSCHREQIKLDHVTKVIHCNRTCNKVLAVRVSCSCCSSCHAVSPISRQELQTVFNNLFTRCRACLRVGGHLQQRLQQAISYVVNYMWGMCGLILPCLWVWF